VGAPERELLPAFPESDYFGIRIAGSAVHHPVCSGNVTKRTWTQNQVLRTKNRCPTPLPPSSIAGHLEHHPGDPQVPIFLQKRGS
jgi:hypothetical protein